MLEFSFYHRYLFFHIFTNTKFKHVTSTYYHIFFLGKYTAVSKILPNKKFAHNVLVETCVWNGLFEMGCSTLRLRSFSYLSMGCIGFIGPTRKHQIFVIFMALKRKKPLWCLYFFHIKLTNFHCHILTIWTPSCLIID